MELAIFDLGELLLPWAGPATLAAVTIGGSILLRKVATRRPAGQRVSMQLTVLGVSAAGLLAVVLTLPIGPDRQGQLLGFLGIVSSAAIALSSTTILGNGLAGLMLRLVRDFRVGDFVRIEGTFGRVTERGIIHTEVQTEDRDLTTLPNLYLVSHPLTIVRASGTILSTKISLGYDVPRQHVQRALLGAAESMGLSSPFVQVLELGDFSVLYRIAGLLEDVQALVSSRSKLNAAVLDSLHEAEIEIVSPTFMNTRAVGETRFIPATAPRPEREGEAPEAVIFDKADDVSALADLEQKLGEEKERRGTLKDEADPERQAVDQSIVDIEAEIEERRTRVDENK